MSMRGNETLDDWVKATYGEQYDWAFLSTNLDDFIIIEQLPDFQVESDDGDVEQGIAIVLSDDGDIEEDIASVVSEPKYTMWTKEIIILNVDKSTVYWHRSELDTSEETYVNESIDVNSFIKNICPVDVVNEIKKFVDFKHPCCDDIDEYAWFKKGLTEEELEYTSENHYDHREYERLPRYYLTNEIIDEKLPHPTVADGEMYDDFTWNVIMEFDFEYRTQHLGKHQHIYIDGQYEDD